MKTLGQRIYYARVSNGRRTLSAFGAEIATTEGRAAGPYHPTTVSEWEKDDRLPSIAAVAAIAKLTGVGLEWLITGVGLPQTDATQTTRGAYA